MKCDEIKTVCYIDAYSTMPVYYAKEVDEAIAELKEENERLKNENKKMYTKLQHDTIIDAMSRSHYKELRATKRALWLARAYIANIGKRLAISNRNKELKEKVERFCRAKEKEYE